MRCQEAIPTAGKILIYYETESELFKFLNFQVHMLFFENYFKISIRLIIFFLFSIMGAFTNDVIILGGRVFGKYDLR